MLQGQMSPVGVILGIGALLVFAVLLVGATDFVTEIKTAMGL